ncbi:unnamed protein product, partial [Heterotrigona itama]
YKKVRATFQEHAVVIKTSKIVFVNMNSGTINSGVMRCFCHYISSKLDNQDGIESVMPLSRFKIEEKNLNNSKINNSWVHNKLYPKCLQFRKKHRIPGYFSNNNKSLSEMFLLLSY